MAAGCRPTRIILDMDSSVSPTHGDQEETAYIGHFGCTRWPKSRYPAITPPPHPANASCPRWNRPFAMMMRWISDVPSQRRLTRALRKKRLATFSDM